jgi:hypothetical protein
LRGKVVVENWQNSESMMWKVLSLGRYLVPGFLLALSRGYVIWMSEQLVEGVINTARSSMMRSSKLAVARECQGLEVGETMKARSHRYLP